MAHTLIILSAWILFNANHKLLLFRPEKKTTRSYKQIKKKEQADYILFIFLRRNLFHLIVSIFCFMRLKII